MTGLARGDRREDDWQISSGIQDVDWRRVKIRKENESEIGISLTAEAVALR